MAMNLTQDDLNAIELATTKALIPIRADIQALHQSLYGIDGSNGLNGRLKETEKDVEGLKNSRDRMWGVGATVGILLGALEWFRK